MPNHHLHHHLRRHLQPHHHQAGRSGGRALARLKQLPARDPADTPRAPSPTRSEQRTGGLQEAAAVAAAAAAAVAMRAALPARLPALLALAALLAALLPFAAVCRAQTAAAASEPSAAPGSATTQPPALATEPATEPPAEALQQAPAAKPRPVNFTQVRELFEAVVEDDELVGRWRAMDARIQEAVRSILKQLFPQIVAVSQDARVSGDCSGGILKWILSLRNLRSWAIKMLDASGKPSAGILEGSLSMLGNYRQCVGVRAPDEDEIELSDRFEEYYRGQFCVLHLRPWLPAKRPFYHFNATLEPLIRRRGYRYYEKSLYDELAEAAVAFNFMDLRLDLCVPSTCSVADVQRVADLISRPAELRAQVMRCDTESREPSLLRRLDRAAYFWLLLPVGLLSLSALATLLSLLRACGPAAAATPSPAKRPAAQAAGGLSRALGRLSAWEALKERLGPARPALHLLIGHTDRAPKPLVLYGIRLLLVLWFVVVHMTSELKYQYLREALNLRNMLISHWPFQLIINSLFYYDSFILLTAFTYGYQCLEFKLADILAYILNKYLRLVLPVLALAAAVVVLPALELQTPVWRNFVDEQSNVCKANGLFNLFFLQNFIGYDKMCLPHTWLLCVELQLIVLAIPLVVLLRRSFLNTEDLIIIDDKTRQQLAACSARSSRSRLFRLILRRLARSRAGAACLALALLGALLNFGLVYAYQLPPAWFSTFPDAQQKNYYFSQYLTKAWSHLSVFVIGLLGGHLCRATLQLRGHQRLASRAGSQRKSLAALGPLDLRGQIEARGKSRAPSYSGGSSPHGSSSTIMAMEAADHTSVACNLPPAPPEEAPTDEARRLLNGKSLAQWLALFAMASLIFSTYSWSTGRATPTVLASALYDAGSRLVWSVSFTTIMLLLCLGAEPEPEPEPEPSQEAEPGAAKPTRRRRGARGVARLLQAPVCIVLGRLSFLTYLILPFVHNFILAVGEQSLFPSLIIIFHIIVGNIVITYALAFLAAILIEQPIRRLIIGFIATKRFNQSA